MFDDFQPGQTVRCTVTKTPGTDDRRQTIQRLMRRDPSIAKGLRKAQEHRARTMHAYVRGGRVWYDRKKASRLAHANEGNSWTMAFTQDIVPDLRSVSEYIKIESA